MGRFEPTGAIEVPGIEHSVVELPWGVLAGALGPSDGSAGAASNVPSALSVLRHAPLYAALPGELDDAFAVLQGHPIRDGQLYPVAVTIVPFLLDLVRRRSIVSSRITDLIATYAGAAPTLEPRLRDHLFAIIGDHAREIIGWLGRFDRGAAALAIHVPALREAYLEAVDQAAVISPISLLALVDLGASTDRTVELATELLDDAHVPASSRLAAAAFLARYGDRSPAMRTRLSAALPPSAPAALAKLVGSLWIPTVDRPVVAPKLEEAEVVFAGQRLVLVRTPSRSVTLPWVGADVQRGDRLQVGLTAHGEPRLVVVTEHDGGVTVVDF